MDSKEENQKLVWKRVFYITYIMYNNLAMFINTFILKFE